MRVKLSGIAVVTGALLAACGGDSTGPAVDRNNPGTGSSTLLVTADVDASDVPGGFVTDLDVSVRDALGNPVSGVTVTIANAAFGVVTLLETGVGTGDYDATRNSFPGGDFILNVVRGPDNVRDVVVGGPGVHTITGPAINATVSTQQPLTVSWTVPSQAKSAEVETRDFGPVVMFDNGVFQIPVESNPARPDQRIRVFRFNELEIAGGLPGSRLRVEIRQTVEPIIVQ